MPMKTIEGYSKEKYTNTSVLLAGGGAKALSDFIGSLSWDSTNKKIKYTPVGGSTTDLVTLSWDNIANKPTEFKPSSHEHTYIKAKDNYTFSSSTLPNSFDFGVSAGFVNSNSGFGSFGSVLTVRTYSGGGGSLQLYAPYSNTHGGSRLKARFGDYSSNNGNSWTTLKEIAWLEDIPTNNNQLTNGAGYITGITKKMVTDALGYTPPTTNTTYNFSGTSFTSGNSNNGEHNANNITSNGHWYYSSNGPSTSLGASTADGALYSQAYSTSWVGQIAQDYRNGNLFTRGKNNGTWTDWKAVSYAGHTHLYLPLSGGTLTSSSLTNILNLNGSASSEVGIRFLRSGSVKGWIGYMDGGYMYIYNQARGKYLKYNDNGTLTFEDNTIWHAGNLTKVSQLTNDSGYLTSLPSHNHDTLYPKKDGTGASGTWEIDITGSARKLSLTSCYNGTTNNDLWSTIKSSNSSYLGTATIYEVYNDGGPDTYGEVLDIISVHNNHWQPQLWFGSGKSGRLRYRNKEYNDNSWGDWRTVAWTSDIPSVGNGTVTVTQAGSTIGSFTMNQSDNTLIALNDTNTNYYPIRSYTTGLQISSYSGSTDCALFVPYATSAIAGAVSTAAQSFAGQKTFLNGIKVGSTDKDQSTDNAKIYFGDSKFVWIGESPQDDALMLNCGTSKNIYFSFAGSTAVTSSNYSTYAKIYMSYSGAVYASSGFYESSDERLKSILNPVKVNLDDLAKLRKIYYLWNNTPEDGRQLGMIAQDVQKLYPELVSMDKNTGYLSLAYDKLSVIALEAIDTLYEEYKQLKERINELEKLLHSKEILK